MPEGGGHAGSSKRVAIVGGGISGLATAYRLTELAAERQVSLQLTLLERSHRLGGVLQTHHEAGCILEGGPDCFITDKPWALQLCERLGINDRLIGTGKAHRRAFVVRNRRLYPVPEGFQLMAPSRLGPLLRSPLFSLAGKLRMAMEPFIPPRPPESDESLADFVTRRLGREALERIAQPMIAGIYGADPHKLSMAATMPRFLKMERDHGSVVRAMWARMRQSKADGAESRGVSGARYGMFASFDQGMQTLSDALVEALPRDLARLGVTVEGLETLPNGGWRLQLSDGEPLEVDAVCLALPAHASGDLLQGVDATLAEELRAIPYAAAATVSLLYDESDFPHSLDGFGFVAPQSEGLAMLGCTFSHIKFPGRAPQGKALLRAFLGEASIGDRDDDELILAVRRDLGELLAVDAEPQLVRFQRWPRSMAQYAVGHLERVAEIEEAVRRLPGLALAGNGYRGIGIPDCIHSGEQAAESIIEQVAPAKE